MRMLGICYDFPLKQVNLITRQGGGDPRIDRSGQYPRYQQSDSRRGMLRHIREVIPCSMQILNFDYVFNFFLFFILIDGMVGLWYSCLDIYRSWVGHR